MDFKWSEEQTAIKNMARNFAEKEIMLVADEYDRQSFFPRELIQKVGKLGFSGTLLPEEFGGTDTGFLAMEIFGAYGYSMQYPIGSFLRDAKLYQIVEGTSNIHRMIIGMDQLGLHKANITSTKYLVPCQGSDGRVEC